MVVAADTVQMDPQALDRVEALFREQINRGSHPGAALAVYRHGQPGLDQALGRCLRAHPVGARQAGLG